MEPIFKLEMKAYPIDGDDHGYEGDIVLLHENGSYRLDSSVWIGDGECVGKRGVVHPAYIAKIETGYTHWLPLDIFFKSI